MSTPLLQVSDLRTYFFGFRGPRVVKAVDGVSFTLEAGETPQRQLRPDGLMTCPRGGFIPNFHLLLGSPSSSRYSPEILNLRGRMRPADGQPRRPR